MGHGIAFHFFSDISLKMESVKSVLISGQGFSAFIRLISMGLIPRSLLRGTLLFA